MLSAKDGEQKDKFAEAKQEAKEGDIHVIKLEDILDGKHSGTKKTNDAKEPAKELSKKPAKEPVKKELSEKSTKPAKNDEKKTVKKPIKQNTEKTVSKLELKIEKKAEPKIAKKEPKPKIVAEKSKAKPIPEPKITTASTKVVPSASASATAEKKPNKTQELDLLKAYSELMRTTDQRRGRAKTAPQEEKKSIKKTAGWLYLGKFNGGEWDQKDKQVLGLNGMLPTMNHAYALKADSNIRNGYPSRGKMPSIQKVLRAGYKVRVMALHNSGRSGHYWAKVAW